MFTQAFGLVNKNEETMTTTTIVFDHRGRTKKGAEGPLEVRITHNRKPFYISTGVRVRASEWQFDRVVNHPQSNELNERLGIILRKIEGIINDRLKDGREIDVAAIKRMVWDVERSDVFLEWLGAEIERLPIREGTMKHYRTLNKRLHEWGVMRSWADVTTDNIVGFDVWLRSIAGKPLPLSDAGRYNYHKSLKCLLNRAVMLDLLPSNPYDRLRGQFKKGESEVTEYLTDEEVAAIEALRPTPGTIMAKARDLFIFQLWTGLAYLDAESFDLSKYKYVNGQWRLVGQRIKTGVPFVSQLLHPAVAVLERNGWEVPQLHNAVYNRALKDIGIAAGIRTRLHSHLARHTFATYMLRHGVKLENVSRMLGHTNIKQTLRYAKVLAEDVHDDFARIGEELANKM